MNVFNIRSIDDSLRLGQLKGNHFDIVIRNLKNQINDSANLKDRILEAIENVKVRKLNFKIMLQENVYSPLYTEAGRKTFSFVPFFKCVYVII